MMYHLDLYVIFGTWDIRELAYYAVIARAAPSMQIQKIPCQPYWIDSVIWLHDDQDLSMLPDIRRRSSY